MKKIRKILSFGVITCIILTDVSAFGMTQTLNQKNNYNILELKQDRSTSNWFGDVSEDFKIYIPSGKEMQTMANITTILTNIMTPFIPSKIASSFLNGVASRIATLNFDDYQSRTYYATVTKRYREVEIGGEFSHFETMFIINIYNDSSHTDYVCSDTEIYEGQLMMLMKGE